MTDSDNQYLCCFIRLDVINYTCEWQGWLPRNDEGCVSQQTFGVPLSVVHDVIVVSGDGNAIGQALYRELQLDETPS